MQNCVTGYNDTFMNGKINIEQFADKFKLSTNRSSIDMAKLDMK
jgi:hypothetical protein